MSIKRRIELLLDAAAARRVERDAKRALDRGTDPRKPTQNLGRVGRAMDGLKAKALAFGATLAAAFAVRRIVRFARESLEAFGRQERAILRVNSALLNMGQFTEENSQQLRDHAAALQRITTVGDEAIIEATASIAELANELTIGQLAKAQEAAIALADTFFDGNLSSAAILLAKSIGSSTNALARYGVEIDTTGSQSDKLNQILEITNPLFLTSQRAATDLSGRYAQLTNSVGDVTESFGGILAEGLGLTDLFLDMRLGVDDFGASLERNKDAVAVWGNVAIQTIQAIWESLRFVVRGLFNFGQLLGDFFNLQALTVKTVLGNAINVVLEGLNKIPGIDIEYRIEGVSATDFLEQSTEILGRMKGNTLDLVDATLDLGRAYRDVGTAIGDAATGQGAVRGGGPGAGSIAGPQGETELDRLVAGITGPTITAGAAGGLADLETSTEQIRQTFAKLWANVQGDYKSADPLGIMVSETAATAAFMRDGFAGVGEAITAQLIAGRAEAEFASGLAALATGLWPPNPAALAAAGQHFAAAAAFRVLGGALGVPGIGGGGGGGAPVGARGTSNPTAEPLGAEVHIYIDPLSPADPDFQRVVLGAQQNAKERFGDNVNVNIHPRQGR